MKTTNTPTYAQQVAALSDTELARHAAIGRMCSCNTCFCCIAKFEQNARHRAKISAPTVKKADGTIEVL